ncbi:MAG TPA: B12-binding domain-containing radical SAM protein [Rectinemataceae bacterium]|nr:B12-binding domain-containing radical SAM protein [Rectinemataceae bacterium]
MIEKNLRVTFVSLTVKEDIGALPLGAGCAAASLVAAKLVSRADMSIVEACVDDDEKELLLRIVETMPQVVGFSLYCWNSTVFAALAARLKDSHPEILLIAGGPDAERFAPERLGEEEPNRPCLFDALFLGEVEASLPAWFAEAAQTRTLGARGEAAAAAASENPNAAGKRGPAILRSRPRDAAALPSPWLEGILEPRRGGSVTWELTRGCPFRCAYCYEGRGSSGLRHFPTERLKKELELFARSGVREVFVLDPTFNTQSARVISLLSLFSERGGGIDWYFEIRAELLDRTQAEAFAAIPCSLQIGLQSVRPEVLKNIGRGINKKKFASKINLLNETGAVFGLDLIYGLPGDSLAGFRESLDFGLSLMPNHLDIFPLAVLPGTTLFSRRKEFSLEYGREPPYVLRSQPGFSAADMEAAAKLARACGIFYSKGRAVPWFLSVLKPLRLSPSAFLAGFDAEETLAPRATPEERGGTPRAPLSMGQAAIEALQCAHLSRLYEKRGKSAMLPAALDLVRYHGAWSRAFADGETSRLELSYPLYMVEGQEILDIESFCVRNGRRPCSIEVKPTDRGPRARIVSRCE